MTIARRTVEEISNMVFAPYRALNLGRWSVRFLLDRQTALWRSVVEKEVQVQIERYPQGKLKAGDIGFETPY